MNTKNDHATKYGCDWGEKQDLHPNSHQTPIVTVNCPTVLSVEVRFFGFICDRFDWGVDFELTHSHRSELSVLCMSWLCVWQQTCATSYLLLTQVQYSTA